MKVMKVIKQYKLLEYNIKETNDAVKVKLGEGNIEGPYYDKSYPNSVFDSEEEAIQEAYSRCKYCKFIIVTLITFDTD